MRSATLCGAHTGWCCERRRLCGPGLGAPTAQTGALEATKAQGRTGLEVHMCVCVRVYSYGSFVLFSLLALGTRCAHTGSVTAPTMSSSRRTRTHTARPNIPRPTSAQSTRTAGQTTTTTTHSHSSTQKHAKHARSGSPRYASHTQNTRANSSRTAHSYTQYYDENGMGDVAKHAREHAWEDEHKHTRAPRET